MEFLKSRNLAKSRLDEFRFETADTKIMIQKYEYYSQEIILSHYTKYANSNDFDLAFLKL